MTFRPFDLDAIGASLVVSDARAQLVSAAAGGTMVVTAPPGTGKTTVVPPLIANILADRASIGAPARPGRVVLTQPRRVAARAAARRLAELDRSALGDRIGYTVRGDHRVSRNTAIEVVTTGVLLRQLLADPGLDGIDAVILDEVHERSLDSDLLLGMLAEVRELRDDLVVVAMSATLDAAGISELLGAAANSPAPIIDVPSVLHPLEVTFAPFTGLRLDERGVTRDFLQHLAQVAVREQQATGHDALVFVPGAREVDEVVRVARALTSDRWGGTAELVEVLPLHGRLTAREQDRAVSGRGPGDPARIVVSTALAESSLTVPGVRLVIDAGLSREVRRDRAREMSGLVTVSSARSSAVQRAGRAARQGPGHAVRAYAEADFARMPAFAPPEISSADLTDAALLLAAWGTPGGRGLALLTPPPVEEMRRAEETLRRLSLVTETGHITPSGQATSRLPVGVREARALASGAAAEGARSAAEVVAALAGDARDAGADLDTLLRAFRTGRAAEARQWRAEADRLEHAIVAAADLDSSQPAGPLRSAEFPSARSADTTHDVGSRSKPSSLAGRITALARPEWIAHRVAEGSRSYLLASGTRAALPERSSLLDAEWIAVREVQRASGRAADGTGAVIRLAARLDEGDALRIGTDAGLVGATRTARIDDGRVKVRGLRTLGAIVLADVPTAPTRDDTGPAFAAHLRESGLGALSWSDQATALRGRLALLHREVGAPWPDVSEAALLRAIDDWLTPDLKTLKPTSSLARIDVAGALRRLLPWPEATRLDALVPERLALPSGGSARILYPDPGTQPADQHADASDTTAQPVVAAKLQELFGLAETPRLVDGRVPVLFHLLSPGRAPLAVTSDLTSFWNGPYQHVRREMRGRYPKHPWPEDPWTAPATAKTTRRMNGSR